MRTYLKAFLFMALAATLSCALPAHAEEAVPAAAQDGMIPPVSSFDNNADFRALTPEKQAKYNEIIKAAEEAMLPLREQMMAKRIQIETMASMPNMDHEAIAKLAAEIAALHTQMIKVHDTMADRLSSEVGIAIPRGTCSDGYTPCPMHRGMPGYGMRGGYGPGSGMGGMMGGRGMMRGYHHQNMMGLMPIVPMY